MSKNPLSTVSDLPAKTKVKYLALYNNMFNTGEVPCAPCGGACCKGCAGARGYLRDEEQFEAAKAEFGFEDFPKDWVWDGKDGNIPLGFNTLTGCRLPVERRSLICTGFVCGKFSNEKLKQAHASETGFWGIIHNAKRIKCKSESISA